MIVFAEVRVALLIFQKIIHPAHVPLEVKAKTAVFRIACDHRPCRGFFRNHNRTRLALMHNGIEVTEKFNRFQILIFSVLVGNPLTILLAVVEIQHGCHGVNAQTVDMVFGQPIQRIGNQEILDLVSAVVKNFGAPIRMLALLWVCILIQRLAVKVCQTVFVTRKMCRNPVQNDTDFMLMQIIDEVHKVLRRAVAGCRRIISRDLIAPRAVKRMLCDANQLDVSISHLLEIGDQLRRQLAEVIKSRIVLIFRRVLFPRARMHLINCHRLLLEFGLCAFVNPTIVRPLKSVNRSDLGCSARAHLCAEAIRVTLENRLAILTGHGIFVQRTFLHARHEQFMNTERLQTRHRVRFAIPAVKIADQTYARGIRCPNGKIHTLLALFHGNVCA